MSTSFLEIGRRLREIRSAAGLSQAEFAEFLGTSYRSYRAYENGQRKIPTELVLKVEQNPNVPRGWLLSGDNLELNEQQLRIVQETIEQGLALLAATTKSVEPTKWSQKFRLPIKIGLSQGKSLSKEDLAEFFGVPSLEASAHEMEKKNEQQ